jgi:preprotein translocase subunit SecA
MRDVEKNLYLSVLDQLWKDHLLTLDHLRQGIGLRAYAQKDPLNEYKKEAFVLFEELLDHITDRVTTILSHIELQVMPQQGLTPPPPSDVQEGHEDPALVEYAAQRSHPADRDPNDPETWGRVGRNETCPCGSGHKYKQCHGKVS